MVDGRRPSGSLRLTGCVLVPDDTVPNLTRGLEALRRRERVNGSDLPADLLGLLTACVEELRARPLPGVSWVSTTVAAEELGVSAQAVRDMARDGRLVGRQLDTGEWLIEAKSVAARAALRALPGKPPIRRSNKAQQGRKRGVSKD